MKKINIYKMLSYLFIISIPMQPILTKQVYYILAFLVCFCTLLLYIKNNKNIILTKYEKMEIVLIIFMFISLLFRSHINEKLKYVLGILRYVIFISCTIRLLEISLNKKNTNKNEIKLKVIQSILNVFTIGTVLASIYVLIVEPSTNGLYGRMGRVVYGGNNGGYIVYSYNLILSTLWSLYNAMINHTNKKVNFIYYCALLILLPCMLLNGTKKSLFACVAYVFLYILLKCKNIVKKFIYLFIGLILVFYGYKLITTNNYLNSIIGYRVTLFINSFSNRSNIYTDFSTQERAIMRSEAIKYFYKSPIFGHGISSFMYYFGDKYGSYLYAHNNYLELLADLGIIGLFINYQWFFHTIYFMLKNKKIEVNMATYLSLFLIITFILEYGTVTFDQIQYILMFELSSYFCQYIIDRKKGDDKLCF